MFVGIELSSSSLHVCEWFTEWTWILALRWFGYRWVSSFDFFSSLMEEFSQSKFLGFDIRGLQSQNKYISDNRGTLFSLKWKFQNIWAKGPNPFCRQLNRASLNLETSPNRSNVVFFLPCLIIHFAPLGCSFCSEGMLTPEVHLVVWHATSPPHIFFMEESMDPAHPLSVPVKHQYGQAEYFRTDHLVPLCLSFRSWPPRRGSGLVHSVIKCQGQEVRRLYLLQPK